MCHVGKRCTPMVFVLLLTLGVLFFGTPVLVSADDLIISEGSNTDLTVQSDLGEGLLLDTMVKMLQRGASIDCSDSESGTFSQFLTSLRDDIVFTVMDYTGIDEVSWLSFNNSLNPLDWEITDTWEITRSGTGLADKYLNNRRLRFAEETSVAPSPDPDYESLYNKISEWHIIHTPNWSVVVPDVWLASTQNDYTGGYFIWDSSIRKAHTYYRANDNPDQWSYITTNQDVYSLNSVITININKNSDDKYNVILPDLIWSNDVFQKSSLYPGTKYYGWRMKYNGSKITANGWYSSNFPSVSIPSSFNTLYDALYWSVSKFKNFNLYVDGIPWFLVGTSGPLVIPIGDTTVITDTNTPVSYTFPEPAYFDYQTLYNLLETLYNNHQVIKWQDIQGVITDVNGVPVVSTVQVYRTDYDVLADEQLHYVPVFYNDQDMTEPIENGVNIINIGASVIPDDLLVVFIWCGSVLIFALVVRRLLE